MLEIKICLTCDIFRWQAETVAQRTTGTTSEDGDHPQWRSTPQTPGGDSALVEMILVEMWTWKRDALVETKKTPEEISVEIFKVDLMTENVETATEVETADQTAGGRVCIAAGGRVWKT